MEWICTMYVRIYGGSTVPNQVTDHTDVTVGNVIDLLLSQLIQVTSPGACNGYCLVSFKSGGQTG